MAYNTCKFVFVQSKVKGNLHLNTLSAVSLLPFVGIPETSQIALSAHDIQYF